MRKTWRDLWTNPPAGVVKLDDNLVLDVQQLLRRIPGCWLIRGPITKRRVWFIPLTLVNFFAVYVGPEGWCIFQSEISRAVTERVVWSSSAAAKAALERRLGL